MWGGSVVVVVVARAALCRNRARVCVWDNDEMGASAVPMTRGPNKDVGGVDVVDVGVDVDVEEQKDEDV